MEQPITLITGLPGSGKTLFMMRLLREAAARADRPIYAAGIDGLAPGLAAILENPKDWQSVEDGSIIFVDEAWKWFGHLHDARQAPTPAYVQALAEIRHRGINLVMTTQMHNQIYPFVRGLVGAHIHVVRHFGMQVATLHKWAELCEDVKSESQRSRAISEKWVYPKDLFGEYKSAEIHTIKRRLPLRLVLIPACVIISAILFYRVYLFVHTYGHSESVKADAAGVAGATVAPVGKASKHDLTAEEWLARLEPRIRGVHGSEPIFDDRKVATVPATYCVIVGDAVNSSCHCYTEQATRIEGMDDQMCRKNAQGGVYDPFRPLPSSRGSASVAVALPVVPIESPRLESGHGKPYIGPDYVPPGG